MTDWVFVLVPLYVLPIILLFRFVGCGLDRKGELEEIPLPKKLFPPDPFEKVPTQAYRDMIVAEPGVIAYWRLVDNPSDIPAGGDAPEAKDEMSFQSGKYITVPEPLPWVEPGAEAGSEPADGDFDPHQPSLIANQLPPTECRFFNGGYVLVEFKPGLYTDEFTIEAWIKPKKWTQETGYEHTLVGAGGYYLGFKVFAAGADGEDRWRVYVAQQDDESGVVEMEGAPKVTHDKVTHLAVTVKTDATPSNPSNKTVTLFIDGKFAKQGTANNYSLPEGAPLFIGINNIESDPSSEPIARHPVLSDIQEVALYSKALSPEVIKKHYDIGIGKGGA